MLCLSNIKARLNFTAGAVARTPTVRVEPTRVCV
jgi:hypothetical protein